MDESLCFSVPVFPHLSEWITITPTQRVAIGLHHPIYHVLAQSEPHCSCPPFGTQLTPLPPAHLLCSSTSLPAPRNPNGGGQVSGQLTQISSVSSAHCHPSCNRGSSLRAYSVLGTQCAGDAVVTGTNLLSLPAWQPLLISPPTLDLLLCPRSAWCTHWIAAAHSALGPRSQVGLRVGPRGLCFSLALTSCAVAQASR